MTLLDVALLVPSILFIGSLIYMAGFSMGRYHEALMRSQADTNKIRELRRIARGNCGAALVHWKVYEVPQEKE